MLVALTILAAALAAAVRSASIAADGTLALRERLAGTWIAQNQLAEYTARPLWPEVARAPQRGQAGMQFAWRETVSGTPNPRPGASRCRCSPRDTGVAVAKLVGYESRSEQR